MVGGKEAQERCNPPAPESPLWLPSLSHPKGGQLSPKSSMPRSRDVPVAGTLKSNPADLYRVETLTTQALPLPACSSQRLQVGVVKSLFHNELRIKLAFVSVAGCCLNFPMMKPIVPTHTHTPLLYWQSSVVPKLPSIDSSWRRTCASPEAGSPQQQLQQGTVQQQSPSKRARTGSAAVEGEGTSHNSPQWGYTALDAGALLQHSIMCVTAYLYASLAKLPSSRSTGTSFRMNRA